MGIEPMTSPLPRECSTTEPLEQNSSHNNTHIYFAMRSKVDDDNYCVKRVFSGREWSGRQDSNLRHPPWKGGALPTELRPHRKRNGGERRIRTFEGLHRQIYSLLPLAARQSLLVFISNFHSEKNGADYRSRTYDRRFTKPMLYQLS